MDKYSMKIERLLEKGLQPITFGKFNEMLKGEGLQPVNFDDYLTIETVYSLHPLIKGPECLQQILAFYKMGGMALMNDMGNRARKLYALRQEYENEKDMGKKIFIENRFIRLFEC